MHNITALILRFRSKRQQRLQRLFATCKSEISQQLLFLIYICEVTYYYYLRNEL